MIKKNRVRTYIERLFCDNCNEEMIIVSENPKAYSYKRYKCPICKDTETSNEIYPKIVYEDV